MPHQDELPLRSILSHSLFPGRSLLKPQEVAEALGCTERHVLDLCEEGSIAAINIAGENNLSERKVWRVPVSAYDDYIKRKSNQ